MQNLLNFLSLTILYSKQRIYTCINYMHASDKKKTYKWIKYTYHHPSCPQKYNNSKNVQHATCKYTWRIKLLSVNLCTQFFFECLVGTVWTIKNHKETSPPQPPITACTNLKVLSPNLPSHVPKSTGSLTKKFAFHHGLSDTRSP